MKSQRWGLAPHLAGALCILGALLGCADGNSVVGGRIADDRPPADDLTDVTHDTGEVALDAPDAGELDVTVDVTADAQDVTSEARPGCTSNADCAMEHENRVCNTATGLCVQCVASNDTCMPAQHCDAMTNRCVDGCRSDEGCAMNPAGSRCDTSRHACAACVTNDHCAAGTLCVGNVCVAGCNDARPCPSGQTCCAGGCVDTASNLSHCGACDNRCNLPNAMSACMNGMCAVSACTGSFADCDMNRSNGCETNTQTDAAHCGMCGTACPTRPNARHECNAGRCELTCNAGFANCDGDATNGCETDLNTASAHCGACGAACTPPNGTGACVMGRCTVGACATGFADCNMNAADGCETDTRINVSNCGACGRSCMARPNAFPGCLGGMCVTSCVMGFQDCDGVADNGCEADVRTSGSNCGACGRSCTVAHATGVCMAGACAVAACEMGFGDCDMNPANGCEVNLQSDPSHCNGCGMRCNLAGATAACAMGRCDVAACNAGRGDCDLNPANGCEVDTQTTVTHCGACGTVCSLPNATAACAGGRCAVAVCNTGFADCDMNPANGCEVNLNTSTTNCNRCGNVCSFAGGSASCVMGACTLTMCAAGLGDCDGDRTNGCETNTNTTAAHCGACGAACVLANATATCAGGRCAVAACNAGFGDCDMNPANGCEVNLQTDVNNCRACGTRCNLTGATSACTAGVCTIAACSAGRADCDRMDSTGCEVDTLTNANHCGACGTVCNLPNATATCTAGACRVGTCNAGFGDCDGNPANGCEVNVNTSTTHCGRCNNACMFANATAACSAGMCALAMCNAGRGNCNANAADGCETDTQTSATHCGGCGTACAFANATATCAGGMCALGACNANFANCNGNAADGCEASLTTVGTAPSGPAARFAPAGSAMDQTPSEDISVEVGPNNEVYVLSYADKIIVFDQDGRYLRNYPARGWSTAWSIAIDRATGEMWVVDPNNSTVVRLNSSGNPVTSWSTGLSGPRGVEFYNNEIYVGDFGNNRVAVFTPSGTAVRNFRSGSLLSPRGLTVGRTTGNLYVTSSGNNTLRVYNPAGTELRAWNTCNTPADVAVDECRDVAYVLCEAGDQWIAYRASTGAQLYAVSTSGAISHSGIAVSADGARLYVSHSHYASRATLLYRR